MSLPYKNHFSCEVSYSLLQYISCFFSPLKTDTATYNRLYTQTFISQRFGRGTAVLYEARPLKPIIIKKCFFLKLRFSFLHFNVTKLNFKNDRCLYYKECSVRIFAKVIYYKNG